MRRCRLDSVVPLHIVLPGSHQHWHRVVMLVEPPRHELLLVGSDVDVDHREALRLVGVVQPLDFRRGDVAVGTGRIEEHHQRRLAEHIRQVLLRAVERLERERLEASPDGGRA